MSYSTIKSMIESRYLEIKRNDVEDKHFRVIILGGPQVGKTTLSVQLKKKLKITTIRNSDDIKELDWSEASEQASKWFDEPGSWVAEGVQMARALRKWLNANPDKVLDVDVVYLKKPLVKLLPGQSTMAKGVDTVFKEIEAELGKRGARIHKPKGHKDAVRSLLAKES